MLYQEEQDEGPGSITVREKDAQNEMQKFLKKHLKKVLEAWKIRAGIGGCKDAR